MLITIAAVGTRLDPWVYAAIESYRTRLPRHIGLKMEEIPLARRRGAADIAQAVETEGERLLRLLRPGGVVLALDEHGQQWSSAELARQLESWLATEPQVAILIGGPDGLSAACKARADRLWSLSRLTLPHALARVLLVEQIYRAWTILHGHPYHRP